MSENPSRIEPTRLENVSEEISDVVAELSARSAVLGATLHPTSAANLAAIVRMVNTHYSNLIEGHDTKLRDIERALAGDFERDLTRRNLQKEAAAHLRVQAEIDRLYAQEALPEPTSGAFICWVHREFYDGADETMLTVVGESDKIVMVPGVWRHSMHNVVVGRHHPPSGDTVDDFMRYFEMRYELAALGKASRIMAVAAAHHRFNFIHPFADGNGRVSRLMSHAMALKSGIGAHGLWSVSRGLARGLESGSEYKLMMDRADSPREGDFDGRGNLSQNALAEFTLWFLKVCLDQVNFMSALFDLNNLERRLKNYVDQSDVLKPESFLLLREALVRGVVERGDAPRITGLPERSARRILKDVIDVGLLASETPKSAVSLRFPANSLDTLFPRLYVNS